MLAIFLDIETTGLDPFRHRPIEIAVKIFDVNTGEKKGEYQSVIRQSRENWDESDPKSIEVNGFTWDLIQIGLENGQVGKDIESFFENAGVVRGEAVFICQNPAFDRAFFGHIVSVYRQEDLNWPYHWLDLASMYWSKVAQEGKEFPGEMKLSKNAIAREYGIAPEEQPHRAMNGVDHLILCYQKVLGVQLES